MNAQEALETREEQKQDRIEQALEALACAVSDLESLIEARITGDVPPSDQGQQVGYASSPPLEAFLSCLPQRIDRLGSRVETCKCELLRALFEVPQQPKVNGGNVARGL